MLSFSVAIYSSMNNIYLEKQIPTHLTKLKYGFIIRISRNFNQLVERQTKNDNI